MACGGGADDSAGIWEREWFIDGEFYADERVEIHYEAIDYWPDSVMVGLHIFNGQCHDTTTGTIYYIRKEFWAPNVFTPDKEINNLFEIIGIGIEHGELYIYNRDGLLIYHTANYLDGWDGRDYNGRPCVQGNYVWKLIYSAVDYPGVLRSEIGSVLLLR